MKDGIPCARNGTVVPDVVVEVSRRILSPFYSVDVARDERERELVVEIGDGQVSDLKNWGVDEFVEMLLK